MAHKIEKVEWKWRKNVKSPGVYRDDEFVKSDNKEEALDAIDFLMKTPKGLTYTITVKRDDGYFTYFRHSMPCLGGLVKYSDSHGDKYHLNPYFPRDIYVAFPEGEITFIACYRQKTKDILDNPYYKFIFSEESPWISAFGDKEQIIFKDNYFVLTNMDTDPTVFYSLMRLGGLAYNYNSNYSAWHPKVDILITKTLQADPRRLAGQKPIKISGGTWREGFGYTRPYNESIFKTSLPHKLFQFRKLMAYPQAPYTNKYFTDTMQKKYDLNFTRSVKITKKIESSLLEAWDFFKDEAKTLPDNAD